MEPGCPGTLLFWITPYPFSFRHGIRWLSWSNSWLAGQVSLESRTMIIFHLSIRTLAELPQTAANCWRGWWA